MSVLLLVLVSAQLILQYMHGYHCNPGNSLPNVAYISALLKIGAYVSQLYISISRLNGMYNLSIILNL